MTKGTSMDFFDEKAKALIERHVQDPKVRDLAQALLFMAHQMDLLHVRLAAIEQQPKTPFFWVWAEGDEFTVGAFATHRGALWHSERPGNKSEPGSDGAWKLIVGTPAAA
jgi:hypothetical protein